MARPAKGGWVGIKEEEEVGRGHCYGMKGQGSGGFMVGRRGVLISHCVVRPRWVEGIQRRRFGLQVLLKRTFLCCMDKFLSTYLYI